MTTGARLVPGVQRNLLHARGVTRCTTSGVAQCQFERVRLVATGARGARRVRAVIGLDELVARAAGLNLHGCGDSSRMRVVTAHAASGLVRMFGVNILVTRGASRGRSRSHVVRSVAIGAAAMRSDAAAANHVELRVAATTRGRLLLLELVRLVATGARSVPLPEQSRGRNHRLLFRVTRDTRCERILGWSVPLRVTSGAGFHQ